MGVAQVRASVRPSVRPLSGDLLFSPTALGVASYIFFLFGLIIPKDLYELLLREPNYMFLDVKTFVFFTSCFCCFWIGVVATTGLGSAASPTNDLPEVRVGALHVLIPTLIGFAANIVSIILTIKSNGAALGFMAAGQADVAKELLETEGTLGSAAPFLMVITWWAWSRYPSISTDARVHSGVVQIVLIFASLSVVVGALLKLGRYELMPPVFGYAMIYIRWKERRDRWGLPRTIAYVIGAIASILVIFSGLSWARGSEDLTAVIGDILGYTLASYNRLTAMIDGLLTYPYAGNGVYLAGVLGYNNTINDALHLKEYLNWPDSRLLWLSEFRAIADAGLNPGYNWSGLFGYVYAEIGWGALAYAIVLGLLNGVFWKSFRANSAFGLAIYPWFAFNILFWFGSNMLFDNRFFVIILTAGLMAWYDRQARVGA